MLADGNLQEIDVEEQDHEVKAAAEGIGVDNATAITFAAGPVKKNKLRHIDARQDWVQALRDSELVKLVKVDTKDNYADLMTKILDPETFTNLRDGMMVNVAIPDSMIE